MAQYPGFIGGTDRNTALTVNAERTINWYPEVATGTPKARTWLAPTPGLAPFVVLGGSPVRALFHEEGRCFAVGGGEFYEIYANQTATHYGTVGMDGWAATITSNGTDGNQLFIVSNGNGFIFDLVTNLLTPITDPDFPVPCAMGAFVDGYFLALKKDSDQFQISALENGLDWDPLDVALVSQTTGTVRALVALHREVWLLGSSTTTVWADIGDPDFPFAPIPGAFLQQGIGSRFGWTVLDNTLYWHGENEDGARVAYRARGYQPERISTHAVEQAWAAAPPQALGGTICWSYQEHGHAFVCFYIPAAETTWVYDAVTQAWHERALWDAAAALWFPHLARCHCFAFDAHLVGDRASAAVYVLSAAIFTDGRVLTD